MMYGIAWWFYDTYMLIRAIIIRGWIGVNLMIERYMVKYKSINITKSPN